MQGARGAQAAYGRPYPSRYFNTSPNASTDFAKQRNDILGLPTDPMDYKDTLNAMEALSLKKSKKPAGNFVSKPRDPQKLKEAAEMQYRQPVPPRADEPQIAVENGNIVCNFEFACFLSALAQRSAGNTVWIFVAKNKCRLGPIVMVAT